MDPRIKDIGAIETRHLFDVVIDLPPRLTIGGPRGDRVLFQAGGGSFEGPKLRGEVVPVGGDWAVFRADGTMDLDVRLTLRTDDGALIQVSYNGRWATSEDVRAEVADPAKRDHIDPSRYYFRTAPLFETGSPDYAWLNDIVCVASGYLVENGIAYRVSEVL